MTLNPTTVHRAVAAVYGFTPESALFRSIEDMTHDLFVSAGAEVGYWHNYRFIQTQDVKIRTRWRG